RGWVRAPSASACWSEADRPVLVQRPVRVVRDLPGVAVGVDEDARVPAPEGLCAVARDRRPSGLRLGDHGVDLGRGADVVGERDPAPAAVVLDSAVLRELGTIPQRDDEATGLEEDHAIVGSRVRLPAERLVERAGAGEVADAEGDQADALLHQTVPPANQARAVSSNGPSGEPIRRRSAAASSERWASSSKERWTPTGPTPPRNARQSSSKSR